MSLLRNGEALPWGAVDDLPFETLRDAVLREVAGGARVAMFFGLPEAGATRIVAVTADDGAGTLSARTAQVEERFPSLTPDCPQVHMFERELFEQTGVRPDGHPWLKPVRSHDAEYRFFSVEGEEIHEVAVGPVHAGIIDPGHFRLQCLGETVIHLEIRLGYQHRGVEDLMQGGPHVRSALLAETLAGDTTVGHALAWTQSVEALASCTPSPRAQAIRAIALELERVANHVGDLGALGTDIGYLPSSAWFGRLRGDLLNLLARISGSRYGRGLIRPGGVTRDITPEEAAGLEAQLARAQAELRDVADLFFGQPSVRARLEGTGSLTRAACDALGLLGPAARACGADRDVRADHPAGVFTEAPIPVASASTGDVLARAQVRWLETQRSLEFLHARLAGIPAGKIRIPCGPPAPHRLAIAMVEGWRGEIVHAILTDADGRFARCKVKDPSFQNWTGLALALRGMQVSDFPLCNKSFNLSYAGHDL
jgi:Ni,Fe-hydrogenase III large subunit